MYNDNNTYLGYTPINMPVFTNATANIQAAVPAPASGGNFWTSLVNIGTKVVSTAKTVAPIAKDLKSQIDAIRAKTPTSSSGANNSSPGAGIDYNAPASSGMSTGAKVGIAAASLLILGGGGFLIYKTNKKK